MSLLKCLCLPNRKSRTHAEERRKWQAEERRQWQNREFPASLSMQSTSKSKLIQHTEHECFEHEIFTSHVEMDTWSKLENQPGVKKRMRIEDLFDRPKSGTFKCSENKHHLNFNSVGYPCLVTPQCTHMESMYGYTPRVVQDVLASSALEGGAVEDYFTECRNDIVLTKFASVERCNSSSESNLDTAIDTPFDSRSKYIVDSEGDYSSDSDMEGDFQELFPDTKYRDSFPISPFKDTVDFPMNPFKDTANMASPYMCQSEYRGFQNLHFDEIFGCDGEVLY